MTKIIIPYGYQPDIAIGYARLDKIMSVHKKSVIIDCRDEPYASKDFPAWHGRNIEAHYGKRRYIHVPELGNMNHKKEDRHKGFALRDQRVGLDRLERGLEQGYTLILLCGCRDYRHCHRSLVVQLLKAEVDGLVVRHPEERERMVPLILNDGPLDIVTQPALLEVPGNALNGHFDN